MQNNIGLFAILIVFSYLFLRLLIVGIRKLEIPEEGKDISLYGKIFLGFIGIASYIPILIIFGVESSPMKWFWIVYIILVFGFQFFIEMKYLKESKVYIVSLIMIFVGVGLSNLFFHN